MKARLIPLAVAAAALLVACDSAPSSPTTSTSTGTAITASSHVAEHTVPPSHSPIPAHSTTPRKVLTATPKTKVISGGTFCSVSERRTIAKNSDGKPYICQQPDTKSAWRWLELPMWLQQHPTTTPTKG